MIFVLFKDGTRGYFIKYIYLGSVLIGQATAYVYRNRKLTWIKPGKSISWFEA